MIQGLVIAAGDSTRFGEDKLIQALHNDTPMVIQSALNMSKAVPHTMVVLNMERAHLVAEFVKHGLTVALSVYSHLGIGHTIAHGINSSLDANGWLIALGDMPFIKSETILQIRKSIEEGAPIAAPYYMGQRGHPVGFSSMFKQDLLTLQGDVGAQPLLQLHADKIAKIECNDPGVVFDIDAPEDLNNEFYF